MLPSEPRHYDTLQLHWFRYRYGATLVSRIRYHGIVHALSPGPLPCTNPTELTLATSNGKLRGNETLNSFSTLQGERERRQKKERRERKERPGTYSNGILPMPLCTPSLIRSRSDLIPPAFPTVDAHRCDTKKPTSPPPINHSRNRFFSREHERLIDRLSCKVPGPSPPLQPLKASLIIPESITNITCEVIRSILRHGACVRLCRPGTETESNTHPPSSREHMMRRGGAHLHNGDYGVRFARIQKSQIYYCILYTLSNSKRR